MNSLRPERNTTAWVSIALTVLAAGALIVSRFVSLEKADETKTAIIARLESDIGDLKRERARISELLVRMDARAEGLADDMREVKGEVKEINGKLSKRGR